MARLQVGDKVAIVSPCAQIGDFSKIKKGMEYLVQLGFVPELGENIYQQNRYLAGSDLQRAADINKAFANTEIKAIFCTRAAAGGTRILSYIDYENARKNRKPVIGFCDNAALQIALFEKAGIVSYNGFSLTYDFKNGQPDVLVQETLQKAFNGEKYIIKSGNVLQSGEAEGVLLPVNLSVLMKLAGTEYFPNLNGKILLLEDVGEKIYKIDLMLQQLKQQPNFDKVKAVIFGKFTGCTGDEEDGLLQDCLCDFLSGTALPAVQNFAFGHVPARYVLPVGKQVKLNADKAELNIS